ncbi:MAG: histidinol-phosphatase [Clostridia bacterium]|nr:histidinol-phosphatase [Clostridia bacterium]
MISSNFHTHTNFVDGVHTPKQVVERAIAMGMTTLGFSEHCYTPLDPDCCLSKEQTVAYRQEIQALKESYGNQIQILCGIEMDYTSEDDITAYDYVIGSVHYLTVDGATYPVDFSAEKTLLCVNTAFGGDFDAYAEAYFALVGKVVEKTGANIIGHFDLITKYSEQGVGPDQSSPRYIAAWQKAMQNLAGKASLEINTGAMSRGCRTTPYPSLEQLRYWRALGGQVVLNSDSHHKDTLMYAFEQGVELARTAGFTCLGFTDRMGVYHQQLGEKE